MIVFVYACAFLTLCRVQCSDFEQEFRLLSKQVRVLLDKRAEDMKMIEENIRKTIYENVEMDGMRKEIQNLRCVEKFHQTHLFISFKWTHYLLGFSGVYLSTVMTDNEIYVI